MSLEKALPKQALFGFVKRAVEQTKDQKSARQIATYLENAAIQLRLRHGGRPAWAFGSQGSALDTKSSEDPKKLQRIGITKEEARKIHGNDYQKHYRVASWNWLSGEFYYRCFPIGTTNDIVLAEILDIEPEMYNALKPEIRKGYATRQLRIDQIKERFAGTGTKEIEKRYD